MKKLLGVVLILFVTSFVVAQNNNAWNDLADVTFKAEMNLEMGVEVEMPVFGPSAMALDGAVIRITGYIIPTDEGMNMEYLIFSAYPFAACFFCGGAGPETVMEVYLSETVNYTTKPITIEGRLELNHTDINQLMYLLKDAKKVK